MAKLVDLTGSKYGRWTVVAKEPRQPGQQNLKWVCRCDCGTVKAVAGGALKDGISKSCGCLRSEQITASNTTHGKSNTPEYVSWQAMHRRCYDPKHKAYHLYGGRGIGVCPEWHSFENFLADMGDRPPNKTLDKLNNDLDYSKGNCRWATKLEQTNNMRSNKTLSLDEVTQTVAQWARDAKVPRPRLDYHLKRGVSLKDAIHLAQRLERIDNDQP